MNRRNFLLIVTGTAAATVIPAPATTAVRAPMTTGPICLLDARLCFNFTQHLDHELTELKKRLPAGERFSLVWKSVADRISNPLQTIGRFEAVPATGDQAGDVEVDSEDLFKALLELNRHASPQS